MPMLEKQTTLLPSRKRAQSAKDARRRALETHPTLQQSRVWTHRTKHDRVVMSLALLCKQADHPSLLHEPDFPVTLESSSVVRQGIAVQQRPTHSLSRSISTERKPICVFPPAASRLSENLIPNLRKEQRLRPCRHLHCRGAPEISAATVTRFVAAACGFPPWSNGIPEPNRPTASRFPP
ncbi:hypothetical protein VTK26DRAFT_2755 [Humicola hyalothermophila]